MTTSTPVRSIPPIEREEAGRLARMEYQRVAEQLDSLQEGDWSRSTDCPLWDVRAVAGHTVGMMGDFGSLPSLVRRMRAATAAAKQSGSAFIDVMTAMQVDDLAPLDPEQLVAEAAARGERAARWRSRPHLLLRRMPMKEEVDGRPETWRMGYLLDIILTRDPWMHRVDVARATGRALVLTPEHDGRIVADVVAEWSRRHGRPFRLTLTGPAGGEYVDGDGAAEDHVTLDAVEFCRVLSGRATGAGLLTQAVPF